MKRILFYLFVFAISSVSAQSDSLSIYGTVTDDSGETVPFANVTLLQDGSQVTGTTTDFDGKYKLRFVKLGDYTLQVSFVGYQTKKIANVKLIHTNLELNISIKQGVKLTDCRFYHYPSFFEVDQTTTGRTFTRQQIQRMPF